MFTSTTTSAEYAINLLGHIFVKTSWLLCCVLSTSSGLNFAAQLSDHTMNLIRNIVLSKCISGGSMFVIILLSSLGYF